MTPNKTVEAVARAICRARLMEKYPSDTADYLQIIVDREWVVWKPEALAAIKAHNECLMEPSEEMIAAGFEIISSDYENDSAQDKRENTIDVFQAMLSAQEKTDDA